MNRRKFISRGLAAAVAAAVSLIPTRLGIDSQLSSKTKAEKLFGRGYEVDFAKLSVGFIYRPGYKDYSPSKEETESLFHEMSKIRPELMDLAKRDFVKGKFYYAVIVEPDKAYCKNLEEQTKISIEHSKRFFNFPELSEISVEFGFPKSSKEIVLNNPLSIYLVAGLIRRKELEYIVETKNRRTFIVSPKQDESLFGIYEPDFHVFPANDRNGPYVTYSNKGVIFCTTTGYLEAIIDAPINELLHCAFKKVAFDYFNKKYRETLADNEVYEEWFRVLRAREEKFVHALGILWLNQYNKDRILGFTEKELKEDYTKAEASGKCYSGMQELAEHIREIGLKEARRLYIEAPDDLFKVIEKN